MAGKSFVISFLGLLLVSYVLASSHSEAPGTSNFPAADITDVYAFVSYEALREDHTVILVNTRGFQDGFAGPNYATLSDKHFYEIYVDSNGDVVEDLTFRFTPGNKLGGELVEVPFDECDEGDCFTNQAKRNFGPQPLTSIKHGGITLNIGGVDVPVALKLLGPVTFDNQGALNFFEYYSLDLIVGDRDFGQIYPVTQAGSTNTKFNIPFDNSGVKGFPDYEAYARNFIYTISIPNCDGEGRVFVGQRKEPFGINIGPIFDLVNFNPIPGLPSSIQNDPENNNLKYKNVRTLALEIPTKCLVGNGDGIIGVWSATRELHHVGDVHVAGKQFSRLGNPLVNELLIGLRDKARYNKITPSEDLEWGLDTYIRRPTFPEIINILFGAFVNDLLGTDFSTIAPSNIPRDDLYAVFFTGITGLNEPTDGADGEVMRLNTNFPPTAAGFQSNMGVIGDDSAGYPNGRRPGDDIVDITLRVAMGKLCTWEKTAGAYCVPNDAPVGEVPLLDGAPVSEEDFDAVFPFFKTPVGGSPASY